VPANAKAAPIQTKFPLAPPFKSLRIVGRAVETAVYELSFYGNQHATWVEGAIRTRSIADRKDDTHKAKKIIANVMPRGLVPRRVLSPTDLFPFSFSPGCGGTPSPFVLDNRLKGESELASKEESTAVLLLIDMPVSRPRVVTEGEWVGIGDGVCNDSSNNGGGGVGGG
jgi:hypothetical protein